jgi:hypothetical protein
MNKKRGIQNKGISRDVALYFISELLTPKALNPKMTTRKLTKSQMNMYE